MAGYNILHRVGRVLRDAAIDIGVGDPFMDLNKVPELKEAMDALNNAKDKYLEKGTPEYASYSALEKNVKEQMNTTGFSHSGTLLNRMQQLQSIIHKASPGNTNLSTELDDKMKDAQRLLTKALSATSEERTSAFASYAKERLGEGAEITATLEAHLDEKKKPGPDVKFKSQHGHTASIKHTTGKKGNDIVEVKVSSIFHPKEAAEDMAKLLHTQGFKRGQFETDGKTYKKDKDGKDIKGDEIEIKGLATLKEDEKKFIDKCLQEKNPIIAFMNIIEAIMFMVNKNAIEHQALECSARGYEVKDMPDHLMERAQKMRGDYAKSEEREQENVRELANKGLAPQTEFGPMTKEQSERSSAQNKDTKTPTTTSLSTDTQDQENQMSISPKPS